MIEQVSRINYRHQVFDILEKRQGHILKLYYMDNGNPVLLSTVPYKEYEPSYTQEYILKRLSDLWVITGNPQETRTVLVQDDMLYVPKQNMVDYRVARNSKFVSITNVFVEPVERIIFKPLPLVYHVCYNSGKLLCSVKAGDIVNKTKLKFAWRN